MILEANHHLLHLTVVFLKALFLARFYFLSMPATYHTVLNLVSPISSTPMICRFMFHFIKHASLVSDQAPQDRLTLNFAKTKAIVIRSNFYINQLPGMETKGVSFGESLVKLEKSVRSLGCGARP